MTNTGDKHTRNSGAIVVEASLIVPIILICTFFVVCTFLFVISEETGRAELVAEAYETGGYETGKKTEQRQNTLKFEKEVYFEGFHLQSVVRVEREGEVCVERLRRWQMYGDIRNQQGDE